MKRFLAGKAFVLLFLFAVTAVRAQQGAGADTLVALGPMLEGVGHVPHVEAPEAFASVLLNFLKN
jgi:pimeloyl-ACP methyl ester carboxylesterase